MFQITIGTEFFNTAVGLGLVLGLFKFNCSFKVD